MTLTTYAQKDTHTGGGAGGGKGGNGGGGSMVLRFILKPTYSFQAKDCEMISTSGPSVLDYVCEKMDTLVNSGAVCTEAQYEFYFTCCPDFASEGGGGVLANPL